MPCSRRAFLVRSSAALAAGLAVPRALRAGQAAPPAATAFEALRRNTGIFTGRGGTIGWLARPDGVVVIDSQFPDTAQACVDGLTSRAPRPVDVLINTHHHGDHTGGNGVFRPIVKKIVAHARVPELQKRAATQQKQGEPTVPDTTFETDWKMPIGNEVVRARHYGAGHTGGDVVVTFEKANVAHMGDLMFHRRHPFIDRPAGASIRNWITTLERVPKDHGADTIYIFGHVKQGLPVTGTAADLKAFRDYLSALLEFTDKAVKAGQSREVITAATALPGFDEYQSAPPMLTLGNVLGVAYDELVGN